MTKLFLCIVLAAFGVMAQERVVDSSGATVEIVAKEACAQGPVQLSWFALAKENGEPLGLLQFEVRTYLDSGVVCIDTLQTDSSGMVEAYGTVGKRTVQVRLLSAKGFLSMDQFMLPDSGFAQFSLEVGSKPPAQAASISADSAKKLEAMVVVAHRDPLHERKQVSQVSVDRSEMQEVSSTQNDPFRVLGTLPGVATINDLSVRPYVRGGDEWETRTFWNGVPILNPYHALSAYSVFNMEAIEDMTVYSGGFPAEGSNSLSGALWLRSRPAPLDSVDVWTQISLLKGHAYVGVPVVKNKFGVYFAYQAFWYDFVIKRFMDASTWFADDAEYEAEVNKYEKYTDLPNFKDLELGFQWKINERTSLNYTMLRALDLFRVLDPTEAAESWNSDSIAQALEKVDTLALVEIPNWIHGLNLIYSASDKWTIQPTMAWQTQDWNVQFDEADTSRPLFELRRWEFHSRVRNLYQYNDRHLFNFGTSVDWLQDAYDVNMPRAAYETLVRGNYDLMETVGLMNPNGYVVLQSDPFNGMGDILSNIMMDYTDTTSRTNGGFWFSDQFRYSERDRFQLGGRIDWESGTRVPFVSPRLAWFHKLKEDQELSVGLGLYNQDNFEFYYRQFNPHLRSEKALHANVEWSWDIRPEYRVEWNNYGKWYWDLVSPRLINTREFDTQDLLDQLVPDWNDLYSTLKDVAYRNGMDTNRIWEYEDSLAQLLFDELDANSQDQLLDLIGERTLEFPNNGVGYAVGTELGFHYDPTRIWRGWASVELSASRRKDKDLDFWYSFRNHRPWAIKWHNYFKMPSNWEMSIRYECAAGLAYTSYTNYEDLVDGSMSDTVLVVGRKNNSRYTKTTRFDLRFEHNSKLFGHPYMSFFEIWNSFNSPNFMLVDNESGEWKWISFSYPLPVIYSGFEFRW